MTRLGRSGLLGVVAVTALIAVACGGASYGDAEPAAPAAASQPQAAPPPAGATAPAAAVVVAVNVPLDFEISVYQAEDVLGGTQVAFSSLFGKGRPVILNFWAGLCPPCRAEMPDLQAFYDDFSDKVTLVGMDVGPFVGLGSSEDGKALLEELGITYPAGTTSSSQVVSVYRVLGMPTSVFLTDDGTIFRTWTGLLNEAKLRELTEDLLTASNA
jgi:thiol-disulfide isomerase/thioredoxin